MFRFCKTKTATSFCVSIEAWGGGGGNGTSAATSTGSTTNASADSGSANGGSTGSAGAGGNSGSTGSGVASNGSGSATAESGSAGGGIGGSTGGGTNGGSGPAAPAAFTATVTQAPADGARYLSGTARLEVRGSGMRNVELLPENGFVPTLRRFTVADDGTSAYLDLDTRVMQNGGIELRLSAFDKPAGASDARELIAMAARTWLIGTKKRLTADSVRRRQERSVAFHWGIPIRPWMIHCLLPALTGPLLLPCLRANIQTALIDFMRVRVTAER